MDLLVLSWALALAGPDAGGASPASSASVVQTRIEASAKAIDGCVARYLQEQPSASGTARITVVYARSGEVRTSRVSTKLEGASNLRACLDGIARRWTLPALASDESTLEVTVAVYPGARFSLAPRKRETTRPGEDRPKQGPLGEFTFQPGGFWNGQWTDQGVGSAPSNPGTGTSGGEEREPAGPGAPGGEESPPAGPEGPE